MRFRDVETAAVCLRYESIHSSGNCSLAVKFGFGTECFPAGDVGERRAHQPRATTLILITRREPCHIWTQNAPRNDDRIECSGL